jgi:hypothetical protein
MAEVVSKYLRVYQNPNIENSKKLQTNLHCRAIFFFTKLPEVRSIIKPIYLKMGIMSEDGLRSYPGRISDINN